MGEWNGLQKSPVLSDTICVSPWENTGRGSVVLHLPCVSEPFPVGLQPKMGALQKWGIWSAQVISFLFTTVQCSVQFLCLTCCPPCVLFAKKQKHTHTKKLFWDAPSVGWNTKDCFEEVKTARCDSARSIEFPGSALGTSHPFVTHRSHFCGAT